ncbi:MAG: hypothetical protein EZS28_039998, partial [Streblomastix strix]
EYCSRLQDGNIEMKGYIVFVCERDGDVSIRYRGQIKAIVKMNEHFESVTGEEQNYNFYQFQSPEDMMIWNAFILTDAAQINSSSLSEVVQSSSQKVTFRSQQQHSNDVFIPPRMVPIKNVSDKCNSLIVLRRIRCRPSSSNSDNCSPSSTRWMIRKSCKISSQRLKAY